MSTHYGDFATGTTVNMVFDTFSATTGAPTATSNFAAADINIYKNVGTTQRSSANGITVTTTFDSVTGMQTVAIDLSDNTDAGFYAAANEYQVMVTPITADGQTMSFWLGTFSIQRSGGALASILARLPNATPGAAGGVAIAGANAATTFASLTVTAATVLTGNVSMAAGLTVTQSTSNASAATFTGNGTGSGIVATSGSGATGDGIKGVAASTNGNGVTMTHSGSGADLNATTTPLVLAKTTNLTGFNDIAATAIVSSGAITTSGGKVSGVILADTVTTYTGNTLQTGDAFARLGVAGVGLTNLGDTRIANLDATVSSRASPTNITAGTITTVTNLTNAPTAGDLTATMKTSVTTAATAATPTVTVGAVAAAASNIKKNTSFDISFPMTDSTNHLPATGLTVTATRSIDGAAYGACVNAVTEVGAGTYNIVFAAADTNGNSIMYKFTAASSDTRLLEVITQP